MKHRFSGAVLAAICLSAVADDASQLLAYSPAVADEVVVTASRAPVPLKDTLASTTVITEQEIQQSQARNVLQLLRKLPGVQVRRNGGRGASSTLSLRGMGSSGTLVLVDGVRIESGTSGSVDIQQIPVDQIDRIEVVRGPRSSLYGSAAMGGVIQIFTRSGKEDGVRYRAGYGSDNTRELGVTASGSTETSQYSLTATHVEADGYDNWSVDDGSSGQDWIDYDDDGYRKTVVSFNGVTQLSNELSAFASFVRTETQSDWDGYSGYPSTEGKLTVTTAGVEWQQDQLRSKLRLGRFNEELESSDRLNVFNEGWGDVIRDEASWENSVQLDDHNRLSFGADYRVEDAHYEVISASYDRSNRDLTSGYVNLSSEFGPLTLEGGLRHDDDEVFGSELTGDGGIAYAITEATKLSLTYGEAFKAPSNNDLYYPGYGNPDLRPETSRTIEAGLDSYLQQWLVSFHVYRTRADDLIAYNPDIFGPENINESEIKGAELQLGARVGTLDVGFSFTYQQPKNTITDEPLALVPRRAAALDLDQELGQWSWGLTLYGQGGQYDTSAEPMPGYGLLALRGAYRLNKQWTFRARLDNALDQDYVEVPGYNSEDRFLMVLVDFTPQ